MNLRIRRRIAAFILFSLWVAAGVCLHAATFFVAPEGKDTGAGTKENPFATIQRAQEAAASGDTVFIRGGAYVMRESQIAKKQRIWAYVINLDKSGTADKPITYSAFENERPVFDFSLVKPEGLRVNAFNVSASWVRIKGLEVTGVQVTIKGHTQSICFANDGSHNIYERLVMHDGQAIGIYSVKGSDNLFLNCDAYRNHDFTSEDGKGGNVDGFGCHPPKGGSGNVFRGCRAWFNSDDGFDCIGAYESVTFENCWAFYSGFSPAFERLGDGNGFKAGGYGSMPAAQLPNPIPRHTIRFCLAVRNKASGFYANHHPGGCDWIGNTAYRNGTNFNMLGRLGDNRTDLPGCGHKLRNNLGFKGGRELSNLDASKSDSVGNSFDLSLGASDKDFISLDEAQLVMPRQANGDLPVITFLHLANGSSLIDKGVDAGFSSRGASPDLGAFEK
ncbi:MAG: right-handed parallel beta-helix repeat-containing protein [Candidatus Sumerlaeota bacterium]|nr:right-handed parallel beta-helix repeat-containing protein [Candidatus Sumerlaeota bacterium]